MTGKRVLTGAGSRRRGSKAPGRADGGLPTPLLPWKFGGTLAPASARKLAAVRWQLAAAATGCGGTSSHCQLFDRLGLVNHYPLQLAGYSSEGATKWDSGYSKISTGIYSFFNHAKLLQNQQVASVSVVSALQAEMVQARAHIEDLELEQQSSKKKVKHFLRDLGEERISFMSREHQKLRAIIDDLKHELSRERRSCQNMEILNSKLLNDLANAKLSAKECIQDYKKERRTRELLEKVCLDLAKKIEEDKTEVEAFKRESLRIYKEGEEERKMLQMAEVWREEQVQMKLLDAKVILEEKYGQMNNLITDLETFLHLRDLSLDVLQVSEAEVIRGAVNSVDDQDREDFANGPPNSDDHCPALVYRETDKSDESHKTPVRNGSTGFLIQDMRLEESCSQETVTHVEDKGSSHTPVGCGHSVHRLNRGNYNFRDGTEDEKIAGRAPLNSEISEISSVTAKQPKKKKSSVYRLWQSFASKGDVHKTISVEANARLSNGSSSTIGTISPERG
ncbi:hypothetical protein RJ639_011348 [Escallonia herrerae]|uniref:Uncharacterized protein n=1 Tax=Escallonia herrerae TaxID=1293975 RepID=A0AA89AR53_9ASTE|nr:hypothetical protein RJ639_011348 [Escallonia herrerae]